MFYVKISSCYDIRNFIWTGNTWVLESAAMHGPSKPKTWKTRRGAEAFIAKLQRDKKIYPSETAQVVQA